MDEPPVHDVYVGANQILLPFKSHTCIPFRRYASLISEIFGIDPDRILSLDLNGSTVPDHHTFLDYSSNHELLNLADDDYLLAAAHLPPEHNLEIRISRAPPPLRKFTVTLERMDTAYFLPPGIGYPPNFELAVADCTEETTVRYLKDVVRGRVEYFADLKEEDFEICVVFGYNEDLCVVEGGGGLFWEEVVMEDWGCLFDYLVVDEVTLYVKRTIPGIVLA